MFKKLIATCCVLALIGLGVFWYVTIPEAVIERDLPAYLPNAENGRTMLIAGGCVSCHMSEGQKDRDRLGGGHGLHSPFGTFYVPNISPDPNDGIGKWTEAEFVTAMWKGTTPRGQHYFPSFPYGSYRNMKLEDVRDLFAHLKTLPAVAGKIRDHDVPFPFNVRRSVGGWKLLFMREPIWTADASKSAEWNRGAYLVNGPGHCAECHTPRNPLGGMVVAQKFAGGPNPEGKGWVPNITQKGLGLWSVKDIAYFLESGQTPDGDSAGGSMTPVIANTSLLSGADRNAMAAYLKSLAPVDGPPRPR